MTMGTQLGLDFVLRPKILKDPRSIAMRFEIFHAENAHVYEELLRLARLAKARGIRKLGIRMLWEVMRWNLLIVTERAPSDFKLNDHYHSRYARMLNAEPDLEGLFELRELKS